MSYITCQFHEYSNSHFNGKCKYPPDCKSIGYFHTTRKNRIIIQFLLDIFLVPISHSNNNNDKIQR